MIELRKILPDGTVPDALVILGSGQSNCFAPDEIEDLAMLEESRVEGHTGRLALLRRGPGTILLSLGRRHLYEGWSMDDVTAVVHAAAEAGARLLVATNAAGGLDSRFRTGDVMLIRDELGEMLGAQLNSIRYCKTSTTTSYDRNISKPGVRRTEHDRAEVEHIDGRGAFGYDRRIEDSFAEAVAARITERGVPLRQGTYAALPGPSYETRAEIRMLRRIGAHAVGMSTIPELIAARRLGMRAVGLSLITNVLSDTARQTLSHDDVIAAGAGGNRRMRECIEGVLDCCIPEKPHIPT